VLDDDAAAGPVHVLGQVVARDPREAQRVVAVDRPRRGEAPVAGPAVEGFEAPPVEAEVAVVRFLHR
jgi:hypothetical protein